MTHDKIDYMRIGMIILILSMALAGCSREAYNPSKPAPQAPKPSEIPEPSSGGVYCSFSCPWNNGQKRVIHGPSILCAYSGTLYGGSSYPEYQPLATIQTSLDALAVPAAGANCPCTYDASYDTTYSGAVGCALPYVP